MESCTFFAAAFLTLGVGALDEDRWIEVNSGRQIGKAELTHEVVTCDRVTVQGAIEHWSSLDNGLDRGVNAAILELRVRLK